MPMPSLFRLFRKAREKEVLSKEKLIEVLGALMESARESYSGMDLYTLLEDERITKEDIPLVQAFATRDAALTYLDDRDIKWLSWRIEAIGILQDLILDSLERSVWDYDDINEYILAQYMNLLRKEHLTTYAYLRLKRSYRGFFPVLLMKRHVVLSLGGAQ